MANRRLVLVVQSISLATLCAFVWLTLGSVTVHHDVWHEMGVVREAMRLGSFPSPDPFSYVATRTPPLRHEWAAGVFAWGAAAMGGAAGIAILNLLLLTGIAVLCVLHLRRSGAGFPISLLAGLLGGLLVCRIFRFPVIAQAYSALLFAVLLWFMERDAAGGRRWIVWWLALFVLWVNLHGGIVIGFAAMGAYAVERLLQRRPWGHIAATLAGMAVLGAVNPDGLDHYRYLAATFAMPRLFIPEWQPNWFLPPSSPAAVLFLASLALFGYTWWRNRSMRGALITAALALGTMRGVKTIGLYGLSWIFFVAPVLRLTPLGVWIDAQWRKRLPAVGLVFMVLLSGALGLVILNRAWRIVIPGQPASSPSGFIYPVGAVEHLRNIGFHGNVMTFFRHGAYVSWELHPNVKVGCDSRYDLVYPPEWVDANFRMYLEGAGDWRRTLAAYPTDLVLVDRRQEFARTLGAQSEWRRVYVDDGFELYERPGLGLPAIDRRGEAFFGSIP